MPGGASHLLFPYESHSGAVGEEPVSIAGGAHYPVVDESS